MSIDYTQRIPNNVDLASDRRLQRALENWQPRFLDWWKDMGPDGTSNYDVYLRTAISAEANGWAHFGYVRMPEYRWGIFLAGRDPNRTIAYGDNKVLQGVNLTIPRGKVVAILGEVASSNSLAMAPKAQEAQVPMVTPSSTNPKVTEVGDYIFRVCFIDPFQGTVMAKYALSKGWKKVALLTDVKQDYSVGLAEYFVKYFTAHGGTITLGLPTVLIGG